MRSREVVGRKIVHVEQHAYYNRRLRAMQACVRWFDLDNGTRVHLHAVEDEGEIVTTAFTNLRGGSRKHVRSTKR